ncbi:hypothetical protein [Chitinophaga filiformis]|nr:hypothetical protein [Chitinophaga filiformis]
MFTKKNVVEITIRDEGGKNLDGCLRRGKELLHLTNGNRIPSSTG